MKVVLTGNGSQRKELCAQKYGLEADVGLVGFLSESTIWGIMKIANAFESLS